MALDTPGGAADSADDDGAGAAIAGTPARRPRGRPRRYPPTNAAGLLSPTSGATTPTSGRDATVVKGDGGASARGNVTADGALSADEDEDDGEDDEAEDHGDAEDEDGEGDGDGEDDNEDEDGEDGSRTAAGGARRRSGAISATGTVADEAEGDDGDSTDAEVSKARRPGSARGAAPASAIASAAVSDEEDEEAQAEALRNADSSQLTMEQDLQRLRLGTLARSWEKENACGLRGRTLIADVPRPVPTPLGVGVGCVQAAR